jgi:hypothetical protein
MRVCVNPDERRNALRITMALLAANHPAMPGTGCPGDRLTRQRQIFKGQNPAGLSWIVSRMQQGPDKYRHAYWIPWEGLLLPRRRVGVQRLGEVRGWFVGGWECIGLSKLTNGPPELRGSK